jgi:hypothetical protein
LTHWKAGKTSSRTLIFMILGAMMSRFDHDFNSVASASGKAKTPAPFSLRLTFEERARLERDSAGMSLGAYIRGRLFGENVAPRKARGNTPVKDHQALGRVLGALGGSRLSQNLNQLAKAVNTGSLPVTPETERDLREACVAVAVLRAELMRALGASAGGEP